MRGRGYFIIACVVACAVMMPGAVLMAGISFRILTSVSLGDKFEQVKAAIIGQTQGIKEFSSEKPQEYAQGLIRSKFLLMLNRAKAEHKMLVNNPKADQIRFLSFSAGSDSYTLGFHNDILNAVLIKSKVPPDTAADGKDNRFSPSRLKNITGYIDSLKKGCSVNPVETDSHGNSFIYKGACQQGNIYIEYHPESDEYMVLFHNR